MAKCQETSWWSKVVAIIFFATLLGVVAWIFWQDFQEVQAQEARHRVTCPYRRNLDYLSGLYSQLQRADQHNLKGWAKAQRKASELEGQFRILKKKLSRSEEANQALFSQKRFLDKQVQELQDEKEGLETQLAEQEAESTLLKDQASVLWAKLEEAQKMLQANARSAQTWREKVAELEKIVADLGKVLPAPSSP